jgi:hypothetical protein
VITVGPDGALWFDEWGANAIGWITTSGATTEFSLPDDPTNSSNVEDGSGTFQQAGIAAGLDGAIWSSWYSNVGLGASQLVRFDTSSVPSVTGTVALATAGTAYSGVVATLRVPGGDIASGQSTATIDWGDGTTSAGTISDLGNGIETISGSHTYTQAGTDTPKVLIAIITASTSTTELTPKSYSLEVQSTVQVTAPNTTTSTVTANTSLADRPVSSAPVVKVSHLLTFSAILQQRNQLLAAYLSNVRQSVRTSSEQPSIGIRQSVHMGLASLVDQWIVTRRKLRQALMEIRLHKPRPT